jgi:poly-gamma-glutamate synthase PgsB/CapB
MIHVVIAVLILFCLGVLENYSHQHKRHQIPIIIHVNGTRGKSTTTRLIAGGLRQGGFKVIAKTTGTAPRFILEDGKEIDIERRGHANIREYLKVISFASRKRADVLVSECMAVHPELQWVSEKKMLKAQIGVITNVREDHLEVMGPTTADAARVMTSIIPTKGDFVAADSEFAPIFQEACHQKGSRCHFVNPASINDQLLLDFPYITFKENIAIALQVCELLGVDKTTAFEGMLQAEADPGVSNFIRLSLNEQQIYFINAFAANDCKSTLQTWEAVTRGKALPVETILGIWNNRSDRSVRVLQLADLLKQDLPLEKLLLIGDWNYILKNAARENFQGEIVDLSRTRKAISIINYLHQTFPGDLLVFGFGNTLGLGIELIQYFRENGVAIRC